MAGNLSLQSLGEGQNDSPAPTFIPTSSQGSTSQQQLPPEVHTPGLTTRTGLDAASVASVICPPKRPENPASGSPAGDEFCYSPLLKQGNIRLLRLLPDKDTKAPIRGQIFEYPLRELGQGMHLYEALSYVWGSEEDKQPIYIRSDDTNDNVSAVPSAGNYRRLLVTANLHSVLSHVRDRFLERVMWIDAVCINQRDDGEKGQQVQSMAMIYAYANRVIVWLGESASGSAEAFGALRKAAKEPHAAQTIDEPTRQTIFALLERPWFQRIWVRAGGRPRKILQNFADKPIQVVQEVAAARNILIKCGPSELDGFTFCSGIGVLGLPYDTRPGLQGLIPPITYLIRDAIFRPRYETDQSEASLLATS